MRQFGLVDSSSSSIASSWFHLSSICILAWDELRWRCMESNENTMVQRKRRKKILTTHWNWMRSHHSFCIISNVCVMWKLQFTLLAFYHFASNTHTTFTSMGRNYISAHDVRVHGQIAPQVIWQRANIRFYFHMYTWHTHSHQARNTKNCRNRRKHIYVLYVYSSNASE